MQAWGVAVVALLVVAWSALSARLTRADVTAPILFAVAGLALGGPGLLDVSLGSSTVELVAEAALVLLLFSDAARIDLSSLRGEVTVPARLLGVGLVLSVGALVAAALALFPGLGGWQALLVAACLAPTDAGLCAPIVTDRRVPGPVRRAINVESGLNDGMITPVVTLAIAAIAGEQAHEGGFLTGAVRELGLGVIVGVGVGVLGGLALAGAARRGWTERGTHTVAVTALAAGSYALALGVHGNGFVAAFLAGLCFGPFRRALADDSLELAEGTGQLLSVVVWFVFGAAMLRPSLGLVDWRILVFAVVALTVARMVPVAISLVGTRLDRTTVAFIGWFGPRGLASLVFALVAFDELGSASGALVAVVSVTVALSVVAHGISGRPLIGRYSARVATGRVAGEGLPPGEDAAAVTTSRRPLGRAVRDG